MPTVIALDGSVTRSDTIPKLKVVAPKLKVVKPKQFKGNYSQLGFESYKAYLNSRLWKNIRASILERDKRVCCVCRETFPRMEVHHKSYDLIVLKGLDLEQLMTICSYCHVITTYGRYIKAGKRKHIKPRPLNQTNASIESLKRIYDFAHEHEINKHRIKDLIWSGKFRKAWERLKSL
jgi:hypothetical protein